MGYYTDYELKASYSGNDPDYIAKLEDEISRMNVFDGGDYKNDWYTNAKWYDYDSDMILLSSKFPEVLFELRGEGERSGDIWLNYYKAGGAMRDCIVITEKPFDELQLVNAGCIPENYSYE